MASTGLPGEVAAAGESPEALAAVRELIAAGQLDAALDALDRLLEARPADPEVLYFRAVALRYAGRLDDAQRLFEQKWPEIRRSLDRLRTDHVDLIQLHALIYPDQWEQALGAGGALEACLEAREEGLVRHIGVTGPCGTP